MSSRNPQQVQSSVGKVNYRAITIPEAKTIISNTITKAVSEILGKDKPLTFHAFRFRWGFKMEALAGTPIPPEVDKWFTAVAPQFSDEELDSLYNNLEKLKEKRQELQAIIDLAAKIDNYLKKAEVEFANIGEVSDNRMPDTLRQEHNLPIMQVKQQGVQMVETSITPQSVVSVTSEAPPILANETEISKIVGVEQESQIDNEVKLHV
jgi:DNA-directed RNA polymerase subunit F